MKRDNNKVDEAVLALLRLGLHEGSRAWKGFDWDSMNRLHERGLISDPRSTAKSIAFTEEGLRQAERVLGKLFTEGPQPGAARPPSEHGYAIIRIDRFLPQSEHSITVKEIVSDLATAEVEVKRLNEVNAKKDCTYFWQTTRVFPRDKSAGQRASETA